MKNITTMDALQDEIMILQKLSTNITEMQLLNNSIEGSMTTTTKTTTSMTDDQYSMALWAQLSWTILFSVMLLIAIGGNIIVIWIVIAHRRMRSVTNYFLVNLSCADLLMSVLNCLFNFIYMVRSDWQFGERYCTISNFIATVTVCASVLTLTGISCDRYLAIVHPLHPRISRRAALSAVALIWAVSSLLGLPCLLYSRTITYTFRQRTRTSCILVWPDGMPTVSEYDYIYQVTFFISTYLIPMALMVWSYSAMGVVLWGSKSIGEMTQRQVDSIRSKRKVVRMFIVVVLIFGVCWLPYHTYFIYTHYDRTILYSKYVQHIYLAFYWCAMANAMVNPIIYYWMNARFRKYFNTALCCWTKLKWPSNSSRRSDVEDDFMPRRKSYNNSRSENVHVKKVQLSHQCNVTRKPALSSQSVVLNSFKRSTSDTNDVCCPCRHPGTGVKQSKSM